MTFLAILPCGCLVDPDGPTVEYVRVGRRTYACCPWCPSTFDWRDLGNWFADNDMEPRSMWGLAPKPLVKFGSDVFEVTDACGCGSPMVRERAGKVTFTLHKPDRLIEELKN